MNKNKLIATLLSFVAVNTYALQSFNVPDGGELTAVISDNDINRIAISGQKIATAKLANNQLKISTDEQTGQIFVFPIKRNNPVIATTKIGNLTAQTITGSVINMFVISETGATYTLHLRLQSIPSETILIKPSGGGNTRASSTDFTNHIVTMIEDMYLNHGTEDGYAVSELNTPIKLWKEVDFTLYKTYSDELLAGSVYILRNKADNQIRLSENQFWKPNTIAIAIEKPVLEPGELTKIFVLEAAQNEER